MNESISYSDLRSRLKASFDRVCEERVPLLVKRRNGEDVVIMSKDDYNAMEETAYLLRSPANAQRLLEALNRNEQDRIHFDDLEALRDEAGI
jgi:antitoxin YefM